MKKEDNPGENLSSEMESLEIVEKSQDMGMEVQDISDYSQTLQINCFVSVVQI